MSKRKNNRSLGRQSSRLQQTINGLLLASALIVVPSAMAEGNGDNTTKRHYHISSGSLSHALSQFAGSAGILLSADARLTDGKSSPGLNGEYTVEEGFQKLLAGSGLVRVFTAGNAVTLKVAEQQSQASPVTLPSMMVMGAAELDVNDPYNKSYTVTNSSTATKTDTPLIETPVSVQVVPRTIMDDQKTTRVKDALENVSGVRAQPTLGYGNGFIIRGFLNNRVYRNGLLTNADGYPSEFDAGNLQSIDVLKGPAAVLFGRIEPGGLVNITTKKPLDMPYYSLEQQFGSYDYYRTQWDATGAVTDDKSLLYRFTGAYQSNNSFRDFVFTDRVMVNPSITWRPTDNTDLTLSVEGLDQDYQVDFGIPAIGARPAPIPISRSLDDPNSPVDHLSHVLVSTEINHRFNDDWAIHNRFLAGFKDDFSSFVNPAPAFGPSEEALLQNGILRRNVFGHKAYSENYATNLDLTGKFQLGFSKHQVLVGFDYFKSTNKYHYFGEFNDPNPALDIDIFNPGPSYGIDSALIQDTLSRPANCCADSNFAFFNNQWYGVYFQDHITLWDKLHILGGGRYDWAESGSSYTISFDLSEATLPSNKDEGFSPRVGILYQPVGWLGIYGNWTTSFSANNAPAADGSTFDPQKGEQFEAGLKTQLFDDRLLATLAYYHLTKDNILVPDNTTAFLFDMISNKQRSQGIELDVTGQITDQVSLIGSYAFTDAKVLVDHDGDTAGNRMPNVPEHAGSLWVKYDVNGYESQDGLSFGVGGVAAGARQGDFANTFQLPGYVRMDAFAAYKMKVGATKVTAQFNIRNLLDKTYYESTDPDSNVTPRLAIAPGAPLTAIGSIRVEY
ncbi:TonB-dependent receptor [Methylobacter sp. BBA5.1]|uniref:TonB-dependent siderophore receptor n=1 Tax=Methylobacter sp. BBA5.1 TaxID=1495064 RepID=UPI0009DDD23A|nr:TonB-dependent receptor [Methylobacter sp. BBA5.1]